LDDDVSVNLPEQLQMIERETKRLGFSMPSDRQTGSLLSTLVTAKPAGKFLEIGTGTGLSTSWLLSGMDGKSSLTSIEIDDKYQWVARQFFEQDKRFQLVAGDAGEWLRNNQSMKFDLIFADAMPGKYMDFHVAWNMVAPGGFYIGDDMLPQDNWPENHQPRVDDLLGFFETSHDCQYTHLAWSTGLIVAVKT